MKNSRFTFSIRSLLTCVACIALFLAIGIRFGAHAIWFVRSVQNPTVTPIPISQLVVEPIAEETSSVIIGPYSLRLPANMCQTFEVHRPKHGGVVLLFTDNARKAIIHLLPARNVRFFPMEDFPSKEGRTDSKIYRDIASASSADFSFTMSAEQLRWHKWLMNNRMPIPNAESIEFVQTQALEANLLRLSSQKFSFEWGTTDGEWKGAIQFIDPNGTPDWIRFSASTFEFRGDPSVFLQTTDAQLKAMVSSTNDANHQNN